MEIQYEIISFDPKSGSIAVKYYCEGFMDGLFYNIDIPINDGEFIPMDEIYSLIESMKPTGQLERVSILSNKTLNIPTELQQFIPEEPNIILPEFSILGADAPPI